MAQGPLASGLRQLFETHRRFAPDRPRTPLSASLDLGGRLCRVQRTRVGAFSRSFPVLRARDHNLLPGSGTRPKTSWLSHWSLTERTLKKCQARFGSIPSLRSAVGTSPEQRVARSVCKKRRAMSPATILGKALSVGRDKHRAALARRHDKTAGLPEPGS